MLKLACHLEPSPPDAAWLSPPMQAHLRAFGAVYAALLVHFSLYPYTGWRSPGAAAWGYWLSATILPVPHFLPVDAILNFMAYIPLGVFALRSQPRSWRCFAWAGVAAWLACAGFSLSLELTQVFLPSRVFSKVDLLFNSLGAVVGVLLLANGHRLPRRIRDACSIRAHRLLDGMNWEATLTLGLWFVCLLAPQRMPFMKGPWLADIAADYTTMDVHDRTDPLRAESRACSVIVGGIGTMAALTGVLLLGLSQIRPGCHRLRNFCRFLPVVGLSGWLLPQLLFVFRGESLLSPFNLWGGEGAIAVATAMMAGICVARSNWPKYKIAGLSFVALCLAVCCTAGLPGAEHLDIQPQEPPAYRIIAYLASAAERLSAGWSMLGMLTAWRLTATKF